MLGCLTLYKITSARLHVAFSPSLPFSSVPKLRNGPGIVQLSIWRTRLTCSVISVLLLYLFSSRAESMVRQTKQPFVDLAEQSVVSLMEPETLNEDGGFTESVEGTQQKGNSRYRNARLGAGSIDILPRFESVERKFNILNIQIYSPPGAASIAVILFIMCAEFRPHRKALGYLSITASILESALLHASARRTYSV
ncbi:hypothetical protein MVEN_00278500 [Mycena venus]|uniref:Uncharacterized protein n=1 Tax=Mycena venus TaxID=2733690 RepID=A0A8H6YZQ2_9AGAR|nr:hypothetical protein MVEN_00278500 [Mycena venus]